MRNDIIEKKDFILKLISENQPKSVICRHLKCKPETLDGYLKKFNVDYKGNVGRSGFYRNDIQSYLNNSIPIKSNELKLKLYALGLKEKQCEECEIKKWKGKEIVFELHHKDGNGENNNLKNLKILCPNCHSQTKDFRKKGKLL
jgi:5-methylcytosine-specific restriction endonuclease McrA